ncbi:MAG: heparan N-sulfatase, partial [Kiritimatiellia bacterium]
ASPADWREEIYAAHTFHEITNYYPTRVVRTRRHKFIWNIAWKLDYPFASDLWHSASWKAVLRNKQNKFGARSVDAYIHRPRFELYDLEKDPDETVNLADEPHCQKLAREFCDKIKKFQQDTRDPWLHKWTYE